MNDVNFQFWLQFLSKLMAAMNTGLNRYQPEYRIGKKVAHIFLKITSCILTSDQSDEKQFRKVSRMALLTYTEKRFKN